MSVLISKSSNTIFIILSDPTSIRSYIQPSLVVTSSPLFAPLHEVVRMLHQCQDPCSRRIVTFIPRFFQCFLKGKNLISWCTYIISFWNIINWNQDSHGILNLLTILLTLRHVLPNHSHHQKAVFKTNPATRLIDIVLYRFH